MARPKKTALTPEKKSQRKQAKIKQKAEFIRSAALSKLPAEKQRRDELFAEADRLKTEQQSISGRISQHKKKMQEVFGLTPQALQIRKTLLDAPDGVYEATCKQVALLLKDVGRPFQLDFLENLEPGKGVAEDDGSIFDKTDAGREERGDDPGRARKAKANGGPPRAPTEGIPLEEAEEKFTEVLRRQNKETEEEVKARSKSNDPLQGAQGTGSYTVTH
jgi:hypothetical protein